MISLVGQPLPIDPEPIARPEVAWVAVGPVLVLVGGALLMMIVGALARRRPLEGSYALFTVVVSACAMAAAVPLWERVQDDDRGPFTALAGAIGVDGFSVFVTVLLCAGVVLAALLGNDYLREEGLERSGEPYVLLLLSASGGVMMASANDLIVLFLGLEILSIAVYVLAAMHLRRIKSQEAGVKYFVLGAFASAFLLYGIALVYGGTGTTNLVRIVDLFSQAALRDNGLVLAGLGLLLVGFGFKIAAVPFHFWTPDVYEGSPTPMVAWMASGVKVAAFAGMLRVFVAGFGAYRVDWQPIVAAVTVVTLVVGSVLAIVQNDVKRMMAYSSISHAGFILLGVQAASDRGTAGALFYLAAYTFMIAGTFGVVTVLTRPGDTGHALDDYRGLSRRRPGLALVFTLFLLAQAGVPLTSGFFAKFEVIAAAVDAGSTWLAAVAMLAAVVAAFVYLRIIVTMYMTEPDEVATVPRVRFAAGLALAFAVLVTLVAGVWPDSIADVARDAVPSLVAIG